MMENTINFYFKFTQKQVIQLKKNRINLPRSKFKQTAKVRAKRDLLFR